MRKILTLLILLWACGVAIAGGEQWPVGARFAGMGHASLTLVDLWSVRSNQAGLAGLEHPVAGAYFQQHWLSSDLSVQGLAFALPVGKGCFGVSANAFGTSALFAQRQFGLAYAMRLSETFRVGVQLDYVNMRFGENYGSTNAITAQAGLQAALNEHLWIGAHLYNPNRAKLGGPYEEKVPTVFGAGLSYKFNEQVLLCAQADKDIDRGEQYRVGIEYHPINALFVRAGVSTGPVQAHFGAGVRLKSLDLDLAVSARSQLGVTPMITVNYRFE
jgi:outer membrane receptor protein involved in Fe transport